MRSSAPPCPPRLAAPIERVDRVHYWFVSDEEFDQLEEKGFLEYIFAPGGQRSGTLRSRSTGSGTSARFPFSTSETDGARYVQEKVPEP